MAQKEKNLAHATPETVDELEEFKIWWNKHGNAVTIVMVAVLLVVIGVQQFNRWQERRTADAMSRLYMSNSPAELEELIAAGKSKPATALARLRLAGVYYSEGQYELAQGVYRAFLDNSPKHGLAAVAQVGLAHSLEAAGKVDEAAAEFKAFVEANPDSFLTTTARLGLGRSLILAGKKDDGKAVLDLLITEAAGTRWASYADELIKAKDLLAVPTASTGADMMSFFSPELQPIGAAEPSGGDGEAAVATDPAPEAPAAQ